MTHPETQGPVRQWTSGWTQVCTEDSQGPDAAPGALSLGRPFPPPLKPGATEQVPGRNEPAEIPKQKLTDFIENRPLASHGPSWCLRARGHRCSSLTPPLKAAWRAGSGAQEGTVSPAVQAVRLLQGPRQASREAVLLECPQQEFAKELVGLTLGRSPPNT